MLYPLLKESPGNYIPEKSIDQNTENKLKLIGITPFEIIRIILFIGWGNSDQSSRNIYYLMGGCRYNVGSSLKVTRVIKNVNHAVLYLH